MAEKDWNEMAVSEKCEFLYTDRSRMIDFLNGLGVEIARLRSQVVPKLNEVAAAVEKLKSQIDAMDVKT